MKRNHAGGLLPPALMAAGIVAYFSLTAEPPLLPAALLTAAATLAALALRRRRRLRLAATGFAAFALGFAAACLATSRAPAWETLPRQASIVEGSIAAIDALPEGRRILIAGASLDGEGPRARALRIRLRTGDVQALSPGDIIRVRALIRLPSPPDYPGGWDTQREAFFAGIGGYGYALQPVQRIEAARGAGVQALRERIAARIMQALPGADGAIAATLLTGAGTAIPPADRAAFQNSGLAHLLAVAGLHIGIVMGLVFGAVRLALVANERAALYWPVHKIASLAALAAGLAYLALTGAHVPIVRSFVMAALATVAVLTGRRAMSLRALAVAAVLLMLISPAAVMGVSFQMSVFAVLALIAGHEALRPARATIAGGSWWRGAARHAGGLATTSILAGTASLPFAAYHFGRAVLWFVPANLVAVPITAFWVMPWGLAALALMPAGLERLALAPMGLGIHLIVRVAHSVAAWPGASIAVPQMPAWGLALCAAGLLATALTRGRLRFAGLIPLAAGLLSPMLHPTPDVLIGPDAAIIAWRQDGAILQARTPRASSFEQAAPERVWGGIPVDSPPCETPTCPLGPNIALVHDPRTATCQPGTILVSSAPLFALCPDQKRVDRFSVWRDGATALYSGDIVTDRLVRGDRPWVISHRIRLPLARAE